MLAHSTTLTVSFFVSFPSTDTGSVWRRGRRGGVGCRMWWRWFWREFILSRLTLKAPRVSFHTFTIFIWFVEHEILRSAPLKSPFRSGVSESPESGEDVRFAVLQTDTSNLIRYDDDSIYSLRIYMYVCWSRYRCPEASMWWRGRSRP